MKNRYNSRADILDECLRSIQEGKATLEDCVRAHPGASPEFRNLLETAVNTWNLMAPIGPSPEYVKTSETRLRRRIQAMQKTPDTRGATRPQSVSWRILRTAIVVLVITALLGSSWGVFSASAQAIPGDPLYPAKLEFERISLAVSWSPIGNVTLLADYSDRRLEEIQQLISKNRDQDLSAGLENYEGTLDLLDAALQRLPVNAGSVQLEDVQARLSHHNHILQDLRTLIPSSTLELFDHAVDRSRQSRELIQNLRLGKGPVNTPPGQQKKDTKQLSPTGQPPKHKTETPLGQQITNTMGLSPTERELEEKTKTPPGQQKKGTEKTSKTERLNLLILRFD
jgi:hypothetical protein